MLGQVIAVKAVPVGVLQQLQPLLINLAVGLLFPLNPVKEAELQGVAVGLRSAHFKTPLQLLS